MIKKGREVGMSKAKKVMLMVLMLPFLVEEVKAQTTQTTGTSLGNIIKNTQSILQVIAFGIIPLIGIVLAGVGFLKLRRKDEDPRSASAGLWYIIAGIGAALVGILMGAVISFYGGRPDTSVGGALSEYYYVK